MYKLFDLECKNMKCDFCDYQSQDMEGHKMAVWLVKYCPICTQPMLTTEDYLAYVQLEARLIKVESWLNKWMPNFLLKRWELSKDSGKIRLEMNGTGIIEVRDEKET